MAKRGREVGQPKPAASVGELDLERVIRFVVVAEELSFTRAAQRLKVDQAWLSRQIYQLEERVGFQLFYRSTRFVELTADGEAFLRYARDLSVAAERVRAGAAEVARTRRSEFRLGVAPFTYWVPARGWLTRRFEESFTAGQLQLLSKSSNRLISDLIAREIDVAVVAEPHVPEGLEAHVIHRSTPGLLIPAEDELARYETVPLTELLGRRVAVTDPRLTPAHDLIYGPLEAAGAIPVVIPEGRRAMYFYARAERFVVVAFGWPHSEPHDMDDFVYRPVTPSLHAIEYVAIRRREAPTVAGKLFWDLVTSIKPDRALPA
jgi:DNA-binding transcriptional LysR family regulator